MNTYSETAAFEPLRRGETVSVRGHGNSMAPLIRNGETVVVAPLAADARLRKGEVVLARVRGQVYLHRVKGLRADQVLIGNNHGGLNGWTPREQVVGRLAGGPAGEVDGRVA